MITEYADPRTRTCIPPTRILWQDGPVEGADILLRAHSGQAVAGAVPVCRLRAGGSLLLDFGREWHGGVQLVTGITDDHRPVRIRLRFGESANEPMGTPDQDHAPHDVECQLPWCGALEIGNTGFRFVRIDMVDEGRTLELKAVLAVSLMRDIPYRGSFRSNDERLNAIWQTGARTVHLCMQDYLWDGIKRDRLVWIGDMHPETMVVCTVFGEQPVVPASLDFVRELTPLPGWMNGISSYSLWWLLIQREWYRYHGNFDYLNEQRGYLTGLLAQLSACVDADGREGLSGWRFLDWPTNGDDEAVNVGLQGLLALGLQAGADLCEALGEGGTRVQCLNAAERLRRSPSAPLARSKQASSLLALAGLADARQVNAEVLAANPLRGLSTFYGYYVLEARALAGDVTGALEVVRRYWGGMLDVGATSFWEDFDLAWLEEAGRIDELTPPGKKDLHADFGAHCYQGLRHSLCHGWSAGPTAWLTRHVLGLLPLAPGGSTVQVRPQLGDLTKAEGTLPTPHGEVYVRHTKKANGEIDTVIDAPAGVTVVR